MLKKLDLFFFGALSIMIAGFIGAFIFGGSAQAASKKDLHDAQGCYFQQDAGTNGAWVNDGNSYCGPKAK